MLPGSHRQWRRATTTAALSCLLVLVALVASASALRGEPTLGSVTFDNSAGADRTPSPPRSRPTGATWPSSRAPTTSHRATTTASRTSSCATSQASTTTLVSRATGASGAGGDGHSSTPSISADGRYVAFDVGRRQPLRRRRQRRRRTSSCATCRTDTTTLVSRATGAGGAGGDGELRRPVDLGRRALRRVRVGRRQPEHDDNNDASPTSSCANLRRHHRRW